MFQKNFYLSSNKENSILGHKLNKSITDENLDVYEIQKGYQIKSYYFDHNNKDITADIDLWNQSIFNTCNIGLVWDNRTNLFAFKFMFNSNNINEISFKFNNDIEKTLKPNLDFVNSSYQLNINSLSISDLLTDINKIKTIQITLKNNEFSRVIGIALNPYYNNYKQDFYIQQEKSLILKFQNGININSDNITSTYNDIKFSPCKIKQGFWNNDILRIETSLSEMFNSNVIQLISLENLPISSSSTSSFSSYLENEGSGLLVKIMQNTYYDLNKKMTIKGFGLNSNPGYLPPFEFSGTFFPLVKLKINNLDFDIAWEEYFEKPYFKDNEGLIKIYLESSSSYSPNWEWIPISLELMNESKKYNFTFVEFKKWLIDKNQKDYY